VRSTDAVSARKSDAVSGRSRGSAESENVRLGQAKPRGGQCGRQGVTYSPPLYNRTPRIRNGTCSPYGAFPWTVQIQVRQDDHYSHLCGGALLSDQFVLTAQHCFTEAYDMDQVQVVVGQHSLTRQDSQEHTYQVEWKQAHPHFRQDGPQSHDLAILKLKTGVHGRVRLSPAVNPICLPEEGEKFKDDLPCVVSGWGQILPGRDVDPECLRAAKVPLINQEQCWKLYRFTSSNLIDGQMCAGYPGGGVDTCHGDSGGPLTCQVGDGSYRLVGVVNWGGGRCGQAGMPGVYTRVQYYTQWIRQKMGLDGNMVRA